MLIVQFMRKLKLKNRFRNIRSVCTFWIAEQTLAHLEAIRKFELGVALDLLPRRGTVLEIGAGTGWQAQALANHGYDVKAIDLASSNYKGERVWPVTEYDGIAIPFECDAFDIVFSSNTLEHIPNVYEFQREVHRVLKPDGIAIHVLPSGSWCLFTIITYIVKRWTIPKAHGEHAGDAFTEMYSFSRFRWARLFRGTGWRVVARHSNGLFYTGCSIMDSRLSIRSRRKLRRVFGSSCHVFALRADVRDAT